MADRGRLGSKTFSAFSIGFIQPRNNFKTINVLGLGTTIKIAKRIVTPLKLMEVSKLDPLLCFSIPHIPVTHYLLEMAQDLGVLIEMSEIRN